MKKTFTIITITLLFFITVLSIRIERLQQEIKQQNMKISDLQTDMYNLDTKISDFEYLAEQLEFNVEGEGL